MISLISSFPFIDVFVPDPSIFLWIAATLADAVNTNGIKALVANGLSAFPVTDNAVFSTGSSTKGLFKNLRDCPIWCKWVFNNFLLAEELFGKALRSLDTCVLVNNNLCEKSFS